MAGTEKGDVVVGIIPTIAAYLLPKLLKGFAARHPLTTVTIMEDITPTLVERLHDGTIDLAVAALPVPGSELECEELFEEQFYAVVPAKHRLASHKSISLTELNREPFLLLKEGHCFRDSLISACHKSKMTPSVVFESGQFATILAMVSAGMGVSAVPAMAVQPQAGCKFIPDLRQAQHAQGRHHHLTASLSESRAAPADAANARCL